MMFFSHEDRLFGVEGNEMSFLQVSLLYLPAMQISWGHV